MQRCRNSELTTIKLWSAERIGEDAAPEVRAGCVVPQTEGKVIVGRDAEVGGLVERSAQRRDQHRRP